MPKSARNLLAGKCHVATVELSVQLLPCGAGRRHSLLRSYVSRYAPASTGGSKMPGGIGSPSK
ncbi:hypothetical protein SAMN05421548_14529 [Paraburkholderia lycopersici]|uniref:Uncharacterized protein n=1 Tax=Paraburkholderia lycopersici TaxID=416944 RepID=A0A1G7CI85_9BURK|nr:hypothetical protein SAMN05421548_14529 [Paraburkholderia lycopersici]